MSNFDEDDEFADIYGEEEAPKTQEAGQEPPREPTPEQPAATETAEHEESKPEAPESTVNAPAVTAEPPAPIQEYEPEQPAPIEHRVGGISTGNIYIPPKDEGKMFIGGLNWETTDDSLKNYFSQFGEVVDCTVMRDNASGRSRGFGFLTFRDAHCVTEVLKKEHFLDGKIIDPKRAIPREEQDKTAKIFVGGVGSDVNEHDFKSFFDQYGTVIDAQLMMDKDTGRPRGFGFVTFDSDQAVERIVSEKFLILKNKPIEVKRAEPRSKNGMVDQQSSMSHSQQGNAYGSGMNPAMMSQYMQQWQAYMAQMRQMMAMNPQMQQQQMNPMMQQMYQQMQQQQQGGQQGEGEGDEPHHPAEGSYDDGEQQHYGGGDDRNPNAYRDRGFRSRYNRRDRERNRDRDDHRRSRSGSHGRRSQSPPSGAPTGPRSGRSKNSRGGRGVYGRNGGGGGYHPYHR
ncbi:nuclear polyadenylated RNA-binding protein 4 [Trichomonascus vanleenenianus]|uniref:Hrp1p n=1 Tax=Trichomonascus vanleenenianus TaxID=2268995 RepID=UPI003ECB6F40